MSRARQVANFDPALFAVDEVSGDKVSGGTIGAGVIGASVTGGAGLSGSTSLGTVTTGTISTGTVIDDPTMTQGSDATGDVYYRAAGGALTRLATTADGHVLTSTGVGAVPAWEALPASSRLKATDSYWTNAAVNINKTGGGSVDNDVLISGAHYLTITPDATTDILEFGYTFNIWAGATFGLFGWGLQKDTDTNFGNAPSGIWRTGTGVRYAVDNEYDHKGGSFVITASEASMSADTTYYVRLTGQTSATAGNWTWGSGASNSVNSLGIRLHVKRWSAS